MKKKKPLLIIIIAVVVLLATGAVYYFVFRDKAEEPEVEEPPVLYTYAIKDSFVTNVKSSKKLFKTTIVLVSNEKNMDAFYETNLYTIRDTILFILRDLTEEDIVSPDIQDNLRETLPASLNKALEIECLVSVYFSDFVMQ